MSRDPKAVDPRRDEADVNKANQRLALISPHLESASIGQGHPRDRFTLSLSQLVETMQLKATRSCRSAQGMFKLDSVSISDDLVWKAQCKKYNIRWATGHSRQ